MVIVAVVLLLLGPDKLPDVAHKLGASWRALKRMQEKIEFEVRDAIPDLPSTGDIARIARSPVNLLNSLADRVDAKEEAAETEAADSRAAESRAAESRAADSGAADSGAEEPSEPEPVIFTPVVSRPTPRSDSSALPPDPSMN